MEVADAAAAEEEEEEEDAKEEKKPRRREDEATLRIFLSEKIGEQKTKSED